MTRFLDRFEDDLSDDEVTGLNQLLDLTDNNLLDLLLARVEPDAAINTPELVDVLDRIRTC